MLVVVDFIHLRRHHLVHLVGTLWVRDDVEHAASELGDNTLKCTVLHDFFVRDVSTERGHVAVQRQHVFDTGRSSGECSDGAGADGIDDNVATTLKIGGTLTEAFVGAGYGTSDEVGVKATGGEFGVVIYSTNDQSLVTQAASRLGAKGSLDSLAVVGIEGLTKDNRAQCEKLLRTAFADQLVGGGKNHYDVTFAHLDTTPVARLQIDQKPLLSRST